MSGTFEGLDTAMKLLIEHGATENHHEEANAQAIKEIDGVKYQWSGNGWKQIIPEIPADEPVPKSLQFFTLQGLVDYINMNTEHLIPEDGEKLILQVQNETTVNLISKPSK